MEKQQYDICVVNSRGRVEKHTSTYFPHELEELVYENEWDIAYPQVDWFEGGVIVGTPEDYYGHSQGYRLVVAPVELKINPLDYVDLEQLKKEVKAL